MCWLKDRHPHRFQELSSSGIFTFAESDTLGLDLTSLSTVTAAQVAVSNDGQAASTCTNAEDLAPALIYSRGRNTF